MLRKRDAWWTNSWYDRPSISRSFEPATTLAGVDSFIMTVLTLKIRYADRSRGNQALAFGEESKRRVILNFANASAGVQRAVDGILRPGTNTSLQMDKFRRMIVCRKVGD